MARMGRPGGQLTTKGGVLEVYMGHYMREWLAQQGMVKSGECPPPDTVYAYANSLQRTVATAQFFITGAFPGCDIPVHHQEKMGTMDPTFNPVITDDSAAFSEQAVAAMEKIEARFNETHDDIHLTINSPNEAMTILKNKIYQGELS